MQYELFFDYPNEVVKVYSAIKAKEVRKKGAVIELPFTMNGHIPVVQVKVGNKKVYLGLDSGAEVNLLDHSYYKALKKNYLSDKNKEKVIGLDRREHEVVSAKVKSTEMKKYSLEEMKFLFMDLSGLSEQFDYRMDGLLGFPFFQHYAVSINYKDKKIFLWE